MNVLILEEIRRYSCAQVRFGLKCVGIEDIPSAPSVMVMAHEQSLVDRDIFLEVLYVIGAEKLTSFET